MGDGVEVGLSQGAVNYAMAKGVVVVAAAGNNRATGPGPPPGIDR